MKMWIVCFVCCISVVQAQTPLVSDFVPPTGYAATSPAESPGLFRIFAATSTDGLTFTSTGKVISDQANVPDLVMDSKGRLYLYYTGWEVGTKQNVTAVALSDDNGKTWYFKYLTIKNLPAHLTKPGAPQPGDPDIILLPDGTFRLYSTTDLGSQKLGIIYSEGTDGINFEYKGIAISRPDVSIIDSDTFLVGDTWHTYTIGTMGAKHYHFTSNDGKTFTYGGEASFKTPTGEYFKSNGYATGSQYRMITFFNPEKNLRSFITNDGTNWTLETGNRMNYTGAPMEELYLKDPAVIRLKDGSYFAVITTALSKNATIFAPVIQNFTSSAVGENTVQIVVTGANFAGATAVYIGTTPVTQFTVNSPTQITFTAPTGVTGAVIVHTPTGAATSTKAYNLVTSVTMVKADYSLKLSPNPAITQSTLEFTLPHRSLVRAAVYDVLGREALMLSHSDYHPGTYTIPISTAQLQTGMYVLHFQTASGTTTKLLEVLR